MSFSRIGFVLAAAALLALAAFVPSTVVAQAPGQQAGQPAQPDKRETAAKLEQVTLYKHGLAHFAWSAVITGDGNIDLEFSPNEMNDVLKSLTVVDLDGGTIASVDYDSKVPIDKELKETNITLSREDTLTRFLASIQGAGVSLTMKGGQEFSGKILGVQTETARQADGTQVRTHALVLLAADGIISLDLGYTTWIKLTDPDLQAQLGRILEVLFATKEKEKKRVRIQAAGRGTRKVMVAYTVPAPVWKTSYRFILEEEKDPFLQGWALVDNTTAHDWKEVTLTLAAGLPISFIHDLYSPLYRDRPVVAVDRGPVAELPRAEMARKSRQLARKAAPRDGAGVLAFGEDEEAADRAFEPGAPPPAESRGYFGGATMAQALEQSVDVQVAAEAAGDLFHYRIEHPVSIERNRSSLVPVLQTRLKGKKVLLVDREARSDRAMNAVFVVNSSGLTLEGGPFTVFDGEAYAGEGMLPLLKPEVDALIPYAIELGAEVRTNYAAQRRDSHQVSVDQGAIWMRGYTDWSTEYVIANKTGHAAAVYLRHPRRHGAELTSEAKPEKTEESHYRFTFDIAAGEEKTFPVVERELRQERLEIGKLAPDQLRLIAQSGVVTPQVRSFLEGIATLQANRMQLHQTRQEAEREIQKISADHGRLRENLNALRNSADEERLRQRYLGRLMNDEDRIEKLRQEIQELLAEIKSLDGQLSEKIKSFRSL